MTAHALTLKIIRKLFGGVWLRISHQLGQSVNRTAAERFMEHEAGWIVIKAGRPIAELSFVRIDPPFYRFRCSLVEGCESELQILQKSTLRAPDAALAYRNRVNSNLLIKDECFFINVQPDFSASIRDVRPCKPHE